MTKTMSIFLDALRFLAAILVVFAHFTQPSFSLIGPDDTIYGIGAVAAFFVLSGFVISYVVTKREGTARQYAAARIARIYSVLVPAILLSSVVLVIGIKLDSAYMRGWVGSELLQPVVSRHAWTLLLERTIFPLTFLNSFRETWWEMLPPLDSPIWSLGYEVGYYILFGVFVFGKGFVRVILLLLVAFLLGPSILRLLPVWLAGVWLHRTTAKMHLTPARSRGLGVLCLLGVVATCVFWQDYARWVSLPHGPIVAGLLQGRDRAYFTYVYYYWGAATCLLILAVAQFQQPLGRILDPIERPIRWCAGHTFSLYLFHFPLFVFLFVTTHYDRTSFRSVALVFVADVLLCMCLSTISEDRKDWWRKTITRCLVGRAAS
jgi:peptidoglycan/LPS O-acetylase OafA/YrhL